jgi:SAM-dependent methyltransferase
MQTPVSSGPSRSPISDSPPVFVTSLSKDHLRHTYADYFGTQPPLEAFSTDYSIWRCSETGMEFCWPAQGGSKSFYEWISSHCSYYPSTRWEYGIVNQIIQSRNDRVQAINVLDVGCGKGDFLRTLDNVPAENRCGIDFNELPLRSCRQRGFTVFKGSLEDALAENTFQGRNFQVVTSFHCLEHVEDPLLFVKQLSEACHEGGSIFVSTPASPISSELNWFNPMNHPPHHLTKWNLKAYQHLANMLGLQLSFYYPKANPLRQALTAVRVEEPGPKYAPTRLQSYISPLQRPMKLVKRWQQIQQRAKSHPLNGADVILVELRKNSQSSPKA